MGRKDRDTADYFPRAVRDGDSMAAVEMLYGNDGYTLWGKTMQALGAAGTGSPGPALQMLNAAYALACEQARSFCCTTPPSSSRGPRWSR